MLHHELMSISLNSTSKWRARNMPSFLEYVGKNGKLPTCLTMSFAAYIAFYSNDVQELTDKGLVCKRAKGNEYTVSDDRWVLEFYNEHKNDDVPTLVHAVMTNEQMWGPGPDQGSRLRGGHRQESDQHPRERRTGRVCFLPVSVQRLLHREKLSAQPTDEGRVCRY